MRQRTAGVLAIAIAGVGAIAGVAFVDGHGGAEAGERNVAAAGVSKLDLILYTIGASTDPYRASSPDGFGLARFRNERFTRVDEVRNAQLGWFEGAAWLDRRRIVVPRGAPPFRRRLIFRLDESGLVREPPLPLPPRDTTVAFSPGGKSIASEPVEPCKSGQKTVWECYRQTGEIYLQRADGSGRRLLSRGHLDEWTPDGRLLVTSVDYNKPYAALDVATGERSLPLDPRKLAAFAGTTGIAVVGTPRWSADGRYIAARLSARSPRKHTTSALVIADATGKPLRLLRSRYVISMFAWSPTGHRLAYTTSGFPDPHELFVVDSPRAPARPVMTTKRHFDWVTWAPDSRRLLLDDPVESLWWLVPAQAPYDFVASPRLGGRPLWCCPVNAYATQ